MLGTIYNYYIHLNVEFKTFNDRRQLRVEMHGYSMNEHVFVSAYGNYVYVVTVTNHFFLQCDHCNSYILLCQVIAIATVTLIVLSKLIDVITFHSFIVRNILSV